MNREKVYSVSAINQYIKNMFSREYALSVVFVKGEISNCKYHSSGHIYFSVKDKDSQLTCVMFRGDRQGLDFTLENGQEVVIGGSINVYERDGKYQMYAKKIVLAGDGFLAEQYEKLKKKLEEKGYFDEDRKLPIPAYAKRVGIVTAQTGAAIQDIINISTRRNPYVQLILYPAKVQGEEAAGTIVRGIERLDEEQVDVIIVGRGGGSMEDLWAFNEEAVAEAIFHCRTPVISAVGHETDFTIADFVSDLRAPTPSAAAELAVYDIRQVMMRLSDYKDRMARNILGRTEQLRDRLEMKKNRLQFFNPQNQMMQKRQRITDLEDKLSIYMNRSLQQKKHEFSLLIRQLDGVSPLKHLQNGYAYLSDAKEKRIVSVEQVAKGEEIQLTLADGEIFAQVQKVVRRT